MDMRQTAVEWLVEQLARKHNEFQALTFYYDHKDEIEQAKEMEEDNITLAYSDGGADTIRGVYKFNNYYKETYNK